MELDRSRRGHAQEGSFFPPGEVPEPDPLTGANRQPAAVRTERSPAKALVRTGPASGQRATFQAGGQFQDGGLRAGLVGQPSAISAEEEGDAGEAKQLAPCPGVPEPTRPVPGVAEQDVAARRKGHPDAAALMPS